MREELPILYRDDCLIAVHKPTGLLVHRSNLDRHETRFALQILRDQIGRMVWPVHRLDKGTSGVLLFALDRDVGRALSSQFERGEVDKTYLAVVRGHPPESGEIDYPLARMADEHAGVTAGLPAQAALTRYRRLATVELPYQVDRYLSSRYALLELKPLTGRWHQLRRHLKHLSHPIIGDATHGKGRHNRLFQELFDCRRLLLAATEMHLNHPVSGEALHLAAPPAEDFRRVVEKLGWDIVAPVFKAAV
ncbi:MAG: pseudouridylate synthase [Gammaproteobacteria bacterium]|nr:pseudouridylate synthase [Gammaproteobacteria bacterium]